MWGRESPETLTPSFHSPRQSLHSNRFTLAGETHVRVQGCVLMPLLSIFTLVFALTFLFPTFSFSEGVFQSLLPILM